MTPRLLETMRAEGGQIALFDLHLRRLRASADALGYAVDTGDVRDAVARRVGDGAGVRGVRLTVGPEGDAEVETWALGDRPFRTAWLDPDPFLEAGGALCVHKTTARDHYRARYDRARRLGADEALLVNERGEVSEGTRTNVWAEIDGRWWTPPLASGGLGGVMRAHLLAARPRAGERRLSAGDLRAASALAVSNALRGWMPVRLLSGRAPATTA